MSTDLMPFDYEGTPVRVVTIDSEPWFVAADVARILGYRMASDMTRRLDDEDRGTRSVRTPSGDQEMTIISESGLYVAILGSQVEGARAFKRWLTHEALPQIRKTGAYAAVRETPLQLAERLVDAERRAEAQSARVLQLEGPAAQAETFRAAEGLCTIGDLANRFQTWARDAHPDAKVLQPHVFDHAGRVGLIIRGNTVRHNQPTSQAIRAGWVKPHRVAFDTNTRGMQTKVSTRLTPSGEARLWDHLVRYLTEHGSLEIKDVA